MTIMEAIDAGGLGSTAKADLGIAAYHFDAATEMNVNHWEIKG